MNTTFKAKQYRKVIKAENDIEIKEHITVKEAKEDPYAFHKYLLYWGISSEVADGFFQGHIGKHEVSFTTVEKMLLSLVKRVPIKMSRSGELNEVKIYDDKIQSYTLFSAIEEVDALWNAVIFVFDR